MLDNEMRLRMFSVAAALMACTAAFADPSGNGKGMLVLQVGSDWCVSGEDVRKVFESDAFRRAVGSKYAFAVYDDMDAPDPKTAAANAAIKGSVVRTKRFPALTCISPHPARFYAQIENLPRNVTAEKLAAAVLKTAKTREEAEKLFRKADSLRAKRPSEAADAYGEAFDMLERQVGEFNVKALREGPLAYAQEWTALCDIDSDDRLGWKRHFTMGQGVEFVADANKYREDGDFSSGEAYIISLRKVPTNHLSAVQRQCLDMAEYALWRKDASRAARNTKLLEHAFSLGRDTIWGQSAMGYLILSGRKIDVKPIKRVEVLTRPAKGGASLSRFPLESLQRRLAAVTPKTELNEQRKTEIALAAVLRLIGSGGWNALHSRPGAQPFIDKFFKDRRWMEDFAWSGPCNGEESILALESLVFQDNGRWIKGDDAGRRFATAVALEYPDKDEAWLADFLASVRETAEAGRLHKRALSQPVWQWRFAVHQGQKTSGVDDAPRQQRFLSKYVNVPEREYGGMCWMVPYRSFNCFGDSVQGPLYYESWEAAGEWPRRRYSPIIGGVCGEISKFGSACSNVHGLPSCTCGQPGHCAYTRRRVDGKWEINYSVTYPTRTHVSFWESPLWTYVQSLEGTFEGDRETRLNADRMIELAHVAEARKERAKDIEAFYRQACRSWRSHYNAWHEYGQWVARSGASLDTMRVWVRGCARGMRTSRQPLWDFFTPYFARVAKEKGAKALADAIVEFAPLLRQDDAKLQEEADFKGVLTEWTEPLSGNRQLMLPVLKALLAAQYGTRDFFSQTLGWGGDAMMTDNAGMAAFFKALEEVVAEKSTGGSKAKLDFSPLILSASKSGNLTAFRQLAQLQDKLEPVARSGKSYPASDFGGELLSSGGMLMTSSTSSWDVPSRYARCIDATPVAENGFHTAKEKSPWAVVVLPGPADVSGILVENNAPGNNAARQLPLEIQVSEDGDDWQTVLRDDEVRSTYKANLRARPVRCRRVRVRRAPDEKEEVFHLGKILVYGRKLY